MAARHPHKVEVGGSIPPCVTNYTAIMETIEQLVCNAILEHPADVLEIDGHQYPVCPPTVATIIMLSQLISQMPAVDGHADNVLIEVLRSAKDMKIVGRIAATLILGAKRVNECRTVSKEEAHTCVKWSWRKFRKTAVTRSVTVQAPEVEYLSNAILDNVSPGTLFKVVKERLNMMQIGDFFALTTSLSEANMLRATREVETAFGEE